MMNSFCGMVDQQKALALFPAETTGRVSHYGKHLTHNEQNLNFRRT